MRWSCLALVLALAFAGCADRQAASRPQEPAIPDGPDDEALPEGGGADETHAPSTSTPSSSPGPTSQPPSSVPPSSPPPTPPPPPPPPPSPPPPNSNTTSDGPPWPQPHDYTQGVWFNWQKRELYVLVLGYQDPLVGKTIERGIEVWRSGLATMAPDLGLNFTVHWAPEGAPPGLQPDILFVPQGFMALIGVPGVRCISTAPLLVGTSSAIHTAAHEFGHCLGLEHVFENGVEYEPAQDIMGKGVSGVVPCPSNLNVAVLRMVYSGQTGELGMPRGHYSQTTSC